MDEHRVRCRRSAACAGARSGQAPASWYVHQGQCTPRLLAPAERLDLIQRGKTKSLGVAVEERPSLGGSR